MAKVSVCIIVKNEEKNIVTCLERLKAYDVEAVVVDTGSTDGTKEAALRLTDSVYEFEWCDDFSAAKNFAASKAKNDYIVSLDADEFMDELDIAQLLDFFSQYPMALGNISLTNLVKAGDLVVENYIKVLRVYDRRFNHFEGRIHEQLRRKDGQKKEVADLNIHATHVGYLKSEEELWKKNKRNIDLLEKEIKEDGNNPYLFFQLNQSYRAMGEIKKSYENAKKALECNPPKDVPYLGTLVIDYGNGCLEIGRYQEALDIEAYFDDYCHLADYMFVLGKIYFANGRDDDALMAFKLATECRDLYNEGMNSYFPYNAMSVIYEKNGKGKEAKECADKAQALVQSKMK